MFYKCWSCDKGEKILPESYPEKCPHCGQDGKWYYLYYEMHPLTYDRIELEDGRTLAFKEKLEFGYEIHTTPEHLSNVEKALLKHKITKPVNKMSWEEFQEMHRVLSEVTPKDDHIALNRDLNFFVVENSMEMLCASVPECFEALWINYADAVDNDPDSLTIDAQEFGMKLKSLVSEIIPPED